MTATFALDLQDGAATLLGLANGQWHRVGDVSLGDTTLAATLKTLVRDAASVDRPEMLVSLPEDQVIRLELPEADGDPGSLVRAALAEDGRLGDDPVRADWDDSARGLHVVAISAITLQEAEAFLSDLGVTCIGATAMPGGARYALVPWFGTAGGADSGDLRSGSVAPDVPLPLPRGADLPDTPVGESSAETPADRVAAARTRAIEIARRDPTKLHPLPEPETEGRRDAVAAMLARASGAAQTGRGWLSVRLALLSLLLIAALAALALWSLRQPQQAAFARPPAPEEAAPPLPQATEPPPPERASYYVPGRGIQAPLAIVTTVHPDPLRDTIHRSDAIALADVRLSAGAALQRPTLPPPAGQVFLTDAAGRVIPSAEGRLSPDGFTVHAGAPTPPSRQRPDRAAPEVMADALRRADLAADDPLRALLPTLRPTGLGERFERARHGGHTQMELAALTPHARPADMAARPARPTTIVASAPSGMPVPQARTPGALRTFKAAQAKRNAAQPVETAAILTPERVTRARTADQATIKKQIDLSKMNLLGTFGAAGDRRALLRLPSGRVVNVSVGDNVDGGRITAIDNGRVRYVKGGQSTTLRPPAG